MFRKINILDRIFLITITSVMLPMVMRPLGSIISSFAYLWAPLTLLTIFYSKSSVFYKTYTIRLLLFYGFFVVFGLGFFLWVYMTEWNFIRLRLEFYYLLTITSIFLYYWSSNDIPAITRLSTLTFYFILVSLIGTNIALFFDTNIVREAARTGSFSESQSGLYKYSGVIGYSYAQAIIFLIPVLVFHIKENKRMIFKRWALILVLIFILITQIRIQVFANFIVSIVIFILSLLGSKKSKFSVFILFLTGSIFLFVPLEVYIDIIYSLSLRFEPNSEMHSKLIDFAIFLDFSQISETTGTASRLERYPMLLEVLFESPLFGGGASESKLYREGGAHLYWMNRLALTGIPVFMFFLYVLYVIYIKVISLLPKSIRFYYNLSIAALILIGLTKAVGGTEVWIMLILIIPGLYLHNQTNIHHV